MHCICCNSADIKSLGTLRGYAYYKCRNCKFRFIFPPPSEEELKAFYNKTRVSTDLEKTIRASVEKYDKAQNNPKKDWFNFVLGKASLLTGAKKMKILEVGSGYGYFVHHAMNKGHEISGTEITKEYAEATSAAINGKIEQADALSLSQRFSGQSFNFIYLEHVFEHLPDPQKTLEQLNLLLDKKSGVLMISVPNSGSLLSRLQGKFWPWACPPEHLFYYSSRSLCSLLTAAGFTVTDCFTGDYYFRSIPQLYSFLPYINFFRRKVLKKENIPYSYTYPRSIQKILLLLPYWLLWPLLKLIPGSGNELVVICRAKSG
jgi:2-polyprenyl-3-methyl-5-hydroxy-6-metoxy-1,4-benzoquinol methylase